MTRRIVVGEREPIRLFVSSTFRDMEAERDHLVTVVLPELRERLQPLGLDFYDIDLRWGVPEHDANGESANSWAYCKRWIEQAQPFFLCMLGERYGWVPPAGEIETPEDRQRYEGQSITAMEIRYAVLDGKLEPRRSFFYLRDTKAPPPPQTPEEVYHDFVDPQYRLQLEHIKQEIEGSGRPVRHYQASWCGDHFEGLEDFGARVLEDLWSGILRDLRYVPEPAWRVSAPKGARDPRRLDENNPIDVDLAHRLVAQVGPRYLDVHEEQRRSLASFAARCLHLFRGRHREVAALITFVLSEPPTQDAQLCVLWGPPGQGKSSLVARVTQALADQSHDGQPVEAIAYFVGAGAGSATARSLLLYVCTEIQRRGLDPLSDAPDWDALTALDLGQLRQNLARQLRNYNATPRLALLLDGINQLSDGHDLAWLPVELAPSVRIVVSCLDTSAPGEQAGVTDVLSALDARRPAPQRIRLDGLTADDAREIIVDYLAEYCKELSDDAIDQICRLEPARAPLYLLVLLRELRTLGGRDLNRAVPRFIQELKTNYPDALRLFGWVLERLEIFGVDAVARWCGYLLVSRDGLSSRELSQLLERQLGDGSGRNALRIERGLRPYLQGRADRLDFFHSQLTLAAWRRYSQEGSAHRLAPSELHGEIAVYLAEQWPQGSAHALSELPFHQLQAGRASESLTTLTTIKFLRAKLEIMSPQDVITDCDLLLDARRSGIAGELDWTSVEALRGTILLSAAILAREPAQLPSQLVGRLAPSQRGPIADLRRQAYAAQNGSWLRPRNASLPTARDAQRFMLHIPRAWGLDILSANRLLVTRPAGFCVVDSDRGEMLREVTFDESVVDWRRSDNARELVVVLRSGEIRWWDLESGQTLQRCFIPTEVLPGHRLSSRPSLRRIHQRQSAMSLARLAPNLRYVVVASWTNEDPVLMIWDLDNETVHAYLEGHVDLISALAFCSHSDTVVSGAEDGRVLAFEMTSGASRLIAPPGNPVLGLEVLPTDERVLIGRDDNNRALLELGELEEGRPLRRLGRIAWPRRHRYFGMSRDGKRVAGGTMQGTIEVFDLDRDAPPLRLFGHPRSRYASGHPVKDIRFDWSEKRIISCGMDRRVRVWDAESGALLHTLPSHAGPVEAISVGDGDVLASLCNRGNLHVWDLAYARDARSVDKHDQPVWVLRRGPTPGTVVSGSFDATLAVWDTETGRIRHDLHGHDEGRIHDIAITPGGLAISCSDDKTLRVWALTTHALLHTLTGHRGSVHCARVSADESRVISGSRDGTLRVWNLTTGEAEAVDEAHKHGHWIRAIAIAPDEQIVASASRDGTVKLWDTRSGRCLQTLNLQGEDVHDLAFVGSYLVTVAQDVSTLRVYEYEQETRSISPGSLRHLRGHRTGATHLEAIPHQNAVASGSLDGSLRVTWLDREKEAVECLAKGDAIRGLSISPDGNAIVVATDGGLDVWSLEGTHMARFSADAGFTGCLALGDTVFVGSDRSGSVHFLDLISGGRDA